jgi:glycosyltransferase involved in cell wall biosynthesis
MNSRLKIFVSAYACEPNLGSEIGVGWHWVLEMSKYFDLWVLTRKSNQHSIEPWIAAHQEYSQIHFLYFDLPKWARFWKKGLRGVRIYYNIWQWCTNTMVKRTMQENDIKIFHHITYGNVLWNVSAYGQKQFFIWGPVGGVETIPSGYSRHYDNRSRILEWTRRLLINILKFNAGYNKRCKNAAVILCKTEICRNRIPARYRDKAILFTDVAAEVKTELQTADSTNDKTTVEYITVGRLDPWRGFDLLIEAFEKAVKKNADIHLTIIGKGIDRLRLQKMIREKGLSSYVALIGSISMEDYYQRMKNCDVVINAALKEGAVTVSFDSMAMGKPLICIDTTGYTRYFSNQYAIVIPLKERADLIDDLQEAIIRLTNKKERDLISIKAKEVGKQFNWENRGKEIYQMITQSFSQKA